LIEFDRFLSSFTEFYRVLPSFSVVGPTGIHATALHQGFTGFYWILNLLNCFFERLPIFIGFYLCLDGFCIVLFSFTGSHLVLLVFTGFYWVSPSFTWFYWFSYLFLRF